MGDWYRRGYADGQSNRYNPLRGRRLTQFPDAEAQRLYDLGYAAAAAGQPLDPQLAGTGGAGSGTPAPAPFYWPVEAQRFYDEGHRDGLEGSPPRDVFAPGIDRRAYLTGYDEARAGKPRRVLPTQPRPGEPYRPPEGAPPGSPPVSTQPDPTTAQGWYDLGYDQAARGVPMRGDFTVEQPPQTGGYYYRLGYLDGAAKRPRQVILVELPGGGRVLRPDTGYELYGSIWLLGGVPYNVARGVAAIGFPVQFDLLASRAEGGFGIAGRSGRVWQLAQETYGGRTPAEVGLPGFVGVVEWSAGQGRRVRLLSAEEIYPYLGPPSASF